MRRYEAIYIVKPSVNKDDLDKLIEKMNGVITQNGGEIIRVDHWGMKKLAYSIEKEYQGYYLYTILSGESNTVQELERILRIDDKILKYLTVKLKESMDIPELTTEETEDDVEEKTDEDEEAA